MCCGIPLLRGDQGVCYGKKRGLGRYISQSFLLRLEKRRSICQRSVIAFELGDHAPTSHTPGPSREGRLICCFFSLKMSCLWCIGIPLLRGD